MQLRNRTYKKLLHPYYFVTFTLSCSFFLSKSIRPICSTLYDNCQLELQEYELLVLLGSFFAVHKKRQHSITYYLSNFCFFAKILNAYLFWKQQAVYSILFCLVWILQACFLREPEYSGPDQVLYLRDTTFEQEVINGDPRVTWLIAFYTIWSPACIQLQPIFAELSQQYGSESLKFGKLDITRFPILSDNYNIDTSSWSRQLPTLIMFRGGIEVNRRPGLTLHPKKVIYKFTASYENIISAFSLNDYRTIIPTQSEYQKVKADATIDGELNKSL